MGMGMGHPCPDAFMRAGHLVPDLSANGVNGEGESTVDKSQQGAHRGVSQELQRVQAVGGL